MEIYTLILITTISVLIYKLSSRNFNYWKQRNVPFEQPSPFVGNLPSLISMRTTIGQWLGHLSKQYSQPYFGLFIFSQPVLVVQDPKLVRAILQKDFSHFTDRAVTFCDDPVMSQVMFAARSPEWKNVRSKLTPVFTTGKLKMMFESVLQQGHHMVDYINKKHIHDIEAKEMCAKYSTDVIAKCAFAIEANSFESEDAEFRYIGRKMFDFRLSIGLRQFAAWLAPPALIKMFKIQFFDPDSIGRLKRIFTDMMEKRKASAGKGHDMVEILLEARRNAEDKSQFSDNVMLAQAIQFFAAGFETSSGAIAFALYELSIHPEMQQKLREEIKENTDKFKGISYDGVQEMKYLDMVICETLRMYPVLPFLDRMCNKDYQLPDSKLVVQKGTPVWIPLWTLHNNPAVFPEPEKFNPERFTDKNSFNNDGLNYIPFGEGPRNCIGLRFGMMTVKLGLITILSRFKVETTKDTPIPMKLYPHSVVLQSNGGVSLKFTPICSN